MCALWLSLSAINPWSTIARPRSLALREAHRPRWGIARPGRVPLQAMLIALLVAPLASCQRSEPAPSSAPSGVSGAPEEASPIAPAPSGNDPSGGEPSRTPSDPNGGSGALPTAPAAPSCVAPLADPPPPAQAKAKECPPDPLADSPPELRRGYVTFVDAPGTPRIGVEIADDDAKRARGLMYRTSMPEEQGMLFSWSDERQRAFWMRNTCIPLDMLFISKEGFIVGILEQVPVMNELSRSVPCPAAHVLEVNAGWVRSHGVKPGMRVAFE